MRTCVLLCLILTFSACTDRDAIQNADPLPSDVDVPDVKSPDASDVDGDADLLEDAGPTQGRATPQPDCTEAGCVRSLRPLGNFDLDALQSYLEEGVTLAHGYSIWVIEYVTKPADLFRVSLATIAVPYPMDSSFAYGIVANAHGTFGVGDTCRLSSTVWGSGLAGLFGARGAIGVATDYPGLGTEGLHPYLVSEVEGAAVLDSLRAAKTVATILKIPTNDRYAVVGLSQGGHASLASAAMHAEYAPELNIRAFGVAAPASMFLEQWKRGVTLDGPHLAYHVLMAYAWSDYYSESNTLWSDEFGARVDDIMKNDCIIDLGYGNRTFAQDIPVSADEIFSPSFLDAYANGTLSGFPALKKGFDKNRVNPFFQTAPLAIWQGDQDTTVPKADTDAVVNELVEGGVDVDYRVVPGGDHINTAFGFVSQNQLRTEESTHWVLQLLYAGQ